MTDNPFRSALIAALRPCLAEAGLDVSGDLDEWIEVPKDAAHGELAVPCFRLSKALRQAPPAIAAALAPRLANAEFFESVTPTGPYINIKVRRDRYAAWAFGLTPNAGRAPNGKTVVIDFSSPNIAKPFGVGHLRSTVIGNALANLYRDRGWKVERINHLGDWGTQFGKLMEAYRRWGNAEQLQREPIHHLYEIYVKFHKAADQNSRIREVDLRLSAIRWSKKNEYPGWTDAAHQDLDVSELVLWANCMIQGCSMPPARDILLGKTALELSKHSNEYIGELLNDIYYVSKDYCDTLKEFESFENFITAFERDRSVNNKAMHDFQDFIIACLQIDAAARAWFKKLEDGDSEARELWTQFRELSLQDFKRIYDLLGVGFDSYNGEAFYNDKLDEVTDLLQSKGLLKESEGAQIVDLESEGMPPCLIRKTDGATLYATRDIAAAIYRARNYKFDRLLYVVGAAQQLHFRQVFAVLKKMGFEWANRCVHVDFGMILGISTRKGTLVFLEDLLDEAVARIGEIVADRNYPPEDAARISEALGVGAVIFNDLSRGRIKDVEFNWERMLAADGDTGPYIQYAQVRAGSILQKAGKPVPSSFDSAAFTRDAHAFALVQSLAEFDNALDAATEANEPSTLAQYLLRTAKLFNQFYYNTQVIGSPDEAAWLTLTRHTQQTLGHGMSLLGLKPLERM